MAFYNNAFRKVMLATGQTVTNTTDFLVTTSGLNLHTISNLGPGYIAILDPQTYTSINPATPPAGDFIIANTSLLQNDVYGMHGGYKMCDLSKLIRPSMISLTYRVGTANAHPFILGIGANTFNSSNVGCTPRFYCDQSYIFRVDVSGSPVLRAMSRNLYRWVEVKTPCCVGGQVSIVDPTSVFIEIAEGILNDGFLSQFILPIVFSNGANGTTDVYYIAPSSFNVTYPSNVQTTTRWNTYTLGTGVLPQNVNAGLILIAAYTDTAFSNCSFSETDFDEPQLITIDAGFVDMKGNPCETLTYCKNVISRGHIGNGYGSTLQKEILNTQAYLQNYLSDDPRIREATGGVDMLINRSIKYHRFGIVHTVPRTAGGGSNANLGPFNTDKYVVEIATPLNIAAGNGSSILNQFLSTFGVHNTTLGPQPFTPVIIP